MNGFGLGSNPCVLLATRTLELKFFSSHLPPWCHRSFLVGLYCQTLRKVITLSPIIYYICPSTPPVTNQKFPIIFDILPYLSTQSLPLNYPPFPELLTANVSVISLFLLNNQSVCLLILSLTRLMGSNENARAISL